MPILGGLGICHLEISTFIVTLPFLPGPGTSSTTNQRSYNAFGQLHGPWCKRVLNLTYSNSWLQKVPPHSQGVSKVTHLLEDPNAVQTFPTKKVGGAELGFR
jgi:hypothetical protein